MKGIHTPIKDSFYDETYLTPNQDLRGVGDPYALKVDWKEASRPLDPTKLPGSGITMAALPSPIVGKYIHLPDGSVSAPGLSWASETNSGRYRIGVNNFGESVGGDLKFDWNASRLRIDTGYDLVIPDITATHVVWSGPSNELTGDAGFTYISGFQAVLIGGYAEVGNYLKVGTAGDAGTTGDLAAGLLNGVRIAFETAAQTFSVYDSSGNEDVRLAMAGLSWYNGSGNFGFGTISADNKVEITSSTGTQLRLSHTDSNNSYTTFGTSSNGVLFISPYAAGIVMNTASDIADGPVYFECTCTDDGDAKYEANALGAGDAVIEFAVTAATTTWTAGIDNSVSDTFKISSSAALGTNDRLLITTAGLVSIPSLTSTRVIFAGASGLLTDDAGFTFDGVTLTLSDSHATTTPLHIFNQASTGDSAIRWSLATTISYAAGIDNSVAGDPFVISTAASGTAVLGTGNILSITSAGVATFTSIVNSALTSGRVTFASTSGLLADDAGLTYSAANDALTVAGWLNNGTSVNAVAAGDFDSGLTTSHYMFWDQSAATLKLHSVAAANIFIMNSSTVQVRDIRFNTGDSLRWIIRCDSTAEGGSNAGSDFRIIRRSDAGADLGVGLFIDRSSGYVAIGNTGSPGQQLQVEGGSLVCNGTANTASGVSGGVFGRLDAIPTNEVPTFVAWLNSGTGYAAGSLGLIARSSAAAPIVMFTGSTSPIERLQIKDSGEAVWNDGGNDYDLRIESDDEPYCFQVESTLNNIVLCAASEPGFQSMDGGVFQAEANVVPTGNPTGGVYKYVEGGAGKGRGTSGTISTYIPAEPHCPKCGYDYIHEWENPGYKQDYLAVCMKCFTDEIGDRPWILRKKAK